MKKINLKIIIFANGQRGYFVLKELLKKKTFNIFLVIPPEKFDIFSEFKNCLEIIKEENVNSDFFINKCTEIKPDINIIAGFRTIFKKELLKIPQLATLNLHAGDLPKYRGGSPLNWQLFNGESFFGTTIIYVDTGIDTGRIVSSKKIKIEEGYNIKNLHDAANKIFPKLTIDAIYKVLEGYQGINQNDLDAVYWPQRNDSDGKINFNNMTAINVLRITKSLYPLYPSAWFLYKNFKFRINKCSMPNITIKGNIGKVIYILNKGPYIIC